MTTRLRPAAAMLGLLALACCGGDRVAPTDKVAIEHIVHDYLLAHPEIIPEAMTAMQSRDVATLLRNNRAEVETPFPGAVAGNPQGDVTLVEFFDYACPYCRAAQADVTRLIAADPKLRVVYRDFPVLTDASGEAALAALSAATQGKYAAFHDRMFTTPGKVDRERTVAIVRAAGLDERRTAADLNNPALKAEIRRNLELGRALGLTGTPTFIVGDRILSGAVGYDKLAEAVAAARRVTAARIAAGRGAGKVAAPAG
jgi:protein-disulfide isomerase